jgi:hypothetical protein
VDADHATFLIGKDMSYFDTLLYAIELTNPTLNSDIEYLHNYLLYNIIILGTDVLLQLFLVYTAINVLRISKKGNKILLFMVFLMNLTIFADILKTLFVLFECRRRINDYWNYQNDYVKSIILTMVPDLFL